MTTFTSTQIRLAARPQGWPTPQDFATESVEYADLQPGQVRVVNDFLSVDPYMRGRMSAARSYVKPYEVGETVTGGAGVTSTSIRTYMTSLDRFGSRF